MPACDNFKIWVLQHPDSHSWRDGAGQGAAQHKKLSRVGLTYSVPMLTSNGFPAGRDAFLDIWVYCTDIFPCYPRDL